MHFSWLDAYFHMAAQGDKEANTKLYKEFKNRANAQIRLAVQQISNFTGNPGDFSDYIDNIYFRTINEYDSEKGSFSYYTDYILTHRLIPKVQNQIIQDINLYTCLDESFQKHKPIELMADPNQKPIGSDIAIKSFKHRIASPGRYRNAEERLRDKVLLLQYAGFSNTEICKELNMTMGELRWQLKKIKEETDVINFKLEMK